MIDNKYNLPNFTAIEDLTYEQIKNENIEIFKNLLPQWQPIESDPWLIAIEAFSYKELQNRLNDNEKIKKLIPHLSSGDDLDVVLFSWFSGIKRLENESDEEFLDRAILSLNRSSTAGAYLTYEYHTYTVDEIIDDVKVLNGLKPLESYVSLFVDKNETEILEALFTLIADLATVEVYIASKEDISDDLLQNVYEALNDEKVRPLTDRVKVYKANEKNITIEATLEIYDINNMEVIKDEIVSNFDKFFKIGEDLIYSELISKLHINGVYKVVTNISDDVIVEDDEVLKITLDLDFIQAVVR